MTPLVSLRQFADEQERRIRQNRWKPFQTFGAHPPAPRPKRGLDLCARCHNEWAEFGYVRCASCRWKHNEETRQRRDAKKDELNRLRRERYARHTVRGGS